MINGVLLILDSILRGEGGSPRPFMDEVKRCVLQHKSNEDEGT